MPLRASRPILMVTLVALSSSQPSFAAIRDSLIGYWPFDEASGRSAADGTTNGNRGYLYNFPADESQWVPGKIGGALRFRGPTYGDYVLVPDYPKPTSQMTLAAWVWADARPVWASIAKNWGGSLAGQFHFGLQSSDGDLSNYVQQPDGGTPSAREGVLFPLGSWQHVAFVCNGIKMLIYRNGTQVASVPYSGGLFNAPVMKSLAIGCKTDNSGAAVDSGAPGFWQGKIDDLGIWKRALSTAEIAAIVSAGQQGRSLLEADVPPVITSAGVRISEFMASNKNTLNDDFGQSSDWIEIHNDTYQTLNLAGWRLTDKASDLAKWPFPGTNLPPGGFLLVFASGLDRRAPGAPLHTNFKLNDAGDYLALVRPDGSIATQFAPAFPAQVGDVSFGFGLQSTSGTYPTNYLYDLAPGYFTRPTPGGPNGVSSVDLGPFISLAGNTPVVPDTNQSLSITCRVSQTAAGVTNVTLNWRVMYGATNRATMFDDGLHGDGAAHDGVYGAFIDRTNYTLGQMVRWFITATDARAQTSRWPLFANPTNATEYLGTVIQPNAVATSALPVLHWFVAKPAAADTDAGTFCSLFYSNRFYDNLHVRIRGGTSRSFPKKSYQFGMNSDQKFLVRLDLPQVSSFDLNSAYTDKSYVRSVLTAEHQRDAGLPVMEEFHMQVRQNNHFFSVAIYVEQPNEDFLSRHGLDPAGALYKALSDPIGTYEKKTRLDENDSDLQSFLSGLTLTGTNLEAFLFDHLNLADVVNYMATVAICQNIDASDKNHFLYCDSNGTQQWRILPWDLDLTFGPDYLNTDTIVSNLCDTNAPHCPSHPFIGARPYLLHSGKYHPLLEAMVNTARTRQMVLRRVRSLSDQFLARNYFQNRIEQLFPLLDSDVGLDHAHWGAKAHFPGLTYTLRQALDRVKIEYLSPRVTFLTSTSIVGIGSTMPSAQPATVSVEIGRFEYAPSSGNLAEQYVCLTNANLFAVDVSGWQLSGDVAYRFEGGSVIPPHNSLYVSPNVAAFLGRAHEPRGGSGLFVQGNCQGHFHLWGGTVALADGAGRLVSTVAILPAPPVTALAVQGGVAKILVGTVSGASYLLEAKEDLADTTWVPILPHVPGNGGTVTLVDTNPPKGRCFYRVRAQQGTLASRGGMRQEAP